MSKARILAVDDQRYFRELVEGLLRDEGYDVHTASSGEEALHVLEREDFAVVVTDLVMPGMEGRELVAKIKERNAEQDVIVVSGVVDVATAVEAMRIGATDYILKPFDGPTLGRAIEKVLERGRLRDEHTRLMEENLEFMSALSLFERATALFTTLSIEPLAERLVEGLCLATRAQSAVVWVAETLGARSFELAGARGLIRVEDELKTLDWLTLEAQLGSEIQNTRSVIQPGLDTEGDALFIPLRFGGEPLAIVRLTDRVDGDSFAPADRAAAEKFCELGATALRNALRFEALERRSLKDPDSHAYTEAYLEDAVRNEIQKANRFGHRFSILRVRFGVDDLPEESASQSRATEARRRVKEMASAVEAALRSTDLLASSDARTYSVLMPQTDALGAGILAQRIRAAIASLDDQTASSDLQMTTVTFPVDGTQLETLQEVLSERLSAAEESLLATRPEIARPQPVDALLDRMLEFGSVEPVEIEGQIIRFVLEDIARRPADRGVLFVSPGARWLPSVLETLDELSDRASRTEIVMIAEAEDQDPAPHLTWATKSSLDSRRPFLVYYGDGPAYAMVGQVTMAEDRAPIFQTADRALVENLAFGLQRELGIVLSV